MAFRHGHYLDSGLSLEQREKKCIAAEKENEKLTSWDDVPLVCEDQDDDEDHQSPTRVEER